MNSRLLELALRKQRLQFRCDSLREQWRDHAQVLAPVFSAVDHVRAGVHWLRRHPEVPLAVGVLFTIARPRIVWRWVRRGVVAWEVWRKGQRWLAR